ncbi:hypothetical protein Gpo141_00001906 [Globisporangium polare]
MIADGDNVAQLGAKRRAAKTPATERQRQRSLLQSLNEVVSVATRRVFQSQLLHHALANPKAIREQLPELCAFADELFHAPNHKCIIGSAVTPASEVQRNAENVRDVFRDPQAQWLTRSAAQSGVTALLCGQLLRCAEEHFAAQQDLAPARLVIVLLCDQLFRPCTLSRKCEWRDRKPAYHAMPCFSTWDTLFPIMERMARRFPQVLDQVLDTYTVEKQSLEATTPRATCNFAHVVGLWRLMEALGGSSSTTSQGSSGTPVVPVQVSADQVEAVMLSLSSSILRFTVRSKVLETVTSTSQVAHEDLKSAAFYADLLMDKFFSGLQEFMFCCPRSKKIAAQALESSIVDSIMELSASDQGEDSVSTSDDKAVPTGLAIFTGVASVFVKGLAGSIVTSLIQNLRNNRSLLQFIVGFSAHVDLVPMDAIFQLLSELLDTYTAVASDQEARVQTLFFMVYVAIYRSEAVASTTSNSSCEDHDPDDVNPYLALLNFQDRFSGEIASEDFYAMPIEWMAILWKHWFAFSDEDLASFIADYEEHHHRLVQHCQANGDQLQELSIAVDRLQTSHIAFRDADGVFVRQMLLLRPHFIAPSHIDKLLSSSSDGELEISSLKRLLIGTLYDHHQQNKHKKRRTGALLDAEAEECKLNVLLLPEVMERVCSFMSAKRLCRLAQVCQGFAEISRSGRLWQGLFFSLTSRDIEPVYCSHGPKYHHNWHTMYRERWEARRRLRKRQRAINTTHQRRLLEQDPDSLDVSTALVITQIPFTARLCHACGCNQVLSSRAQVDEHKRLHEQYKCEDENACGATFASLAQIKKHVKEEHPEQATSTVVTGANNKNQKKSAKPRFDCDIEGCTRSYTSQKRLESHRRLKHHDGSGVAAVFGGAE